MSTLVPREQLGTVEAEARGRVEAAEAARRALQQELLVQLVHVEVVRALP